MGNRRLGSKRLEAVVDQLLSNAGGTGINGSPFALRDGDRYYLEEYFAQLPKLNASLIIDANADDAAALAVYTATNKNFEILGTNASNDDVTFSAACAGIQLQTDGADNDSVIVLPHLDSVQSAWGKAGQWGSENRPEWECVIRTDSSVADMAFWGGLKLTNTPVYATDTDQAYFLYDSTDDSGALTTNANLHFVYSSGGSDFVTDLGIAVAANTTYRLTVTLDGDRKPSAFVDGVQYNLTSATTAGGVSGLGKGKVKGTALADDKDLIPYNGLIARTDAAKTLVLSCIRMSRIIFEV
tara:strand:+ start:83 stop:976 length:894 start_codon:yes stop_codon:yes gene_type:complete